MSKKLLQSEKCYLHIIDPQERLMRQIREADRVTETILKMVHCAKIIGIPVIANTQYKKGLGLYDQKLEELMNDIPRPDKIEFNALANKETAKFINTFPSTVDTGILVGVETHICIYQTALGMQEKGLTPWIVADGVSSRTVFNHKQGLERLQCLGIPVGPAEMIIYELLAQAGTEEFKAILPHII